jgi:hypothetical protein
MLVISYYRVHQDTLNIDKTKVSGIKIRDSQQKKKRINAHYLTIGEAELTYLHQES